MKASQFTALFTLIFLLHIGVSSLQAETAAEIPAEKVVEAVTETVTETTTAETVKAAEAAAEAPVADEKMKEMMAKWEAASTPGEGHKILDKLVGNWAASVKWWMSAGGKPEESTGTSANQWIFDGRFLEQKFSGVSMGKPFEGIGYTGYDNLTQTYQSVWMDSMSTAMMISTGSYDQIASVLHENGTVSCPMAGGPRQVRSTTRWNEDGSYVFEMFTKDEETKEEYRSMEIVYSKKS